MEKEVKQNGSRVPGFYLRLLVFIAILGLATEVNAQVVVYRVNAGGPTTEAGNITYPDWGEDQQAAVDPPPIQFARSGTPSAYVNASVAGDQTAGRNKEHILDNITDPAAVEALFTTQRWDPFSPADSMVWSFPVSVEREYKVVLYFSELFGEGLNTREFDILVEGQAIATDFDILETTSNLEKVGVVIEHQQFAGDSSLDIAFVAKTDLPPLVSAIEIIDMSSTNQAPTITEVGTQFNSEGEQVSLQIQATDPDGQDDANGLFVVSYEAENLPPGLSLDTSSGLITGTIELGAGGIYDVRVIVLDNGFPTAGAISHFTWDVSAGDPIVASPLPDLDRLVGDADDVIDLSTVFSDPAGLTLTYSLDDNTDDTVVAASLDGSELTLSYLAIGTSDITVSAMNTLEGTVSDVFTVTVQGDGVAEALVRVTPTNDLGASTFNGGSIVIQNNSDEGIRIESVSIDLSTAIFPDVVFDPLGDAGDSGSKCLTPDSGETETGFVTPDDLCVDPFSNANEGGFYTMSMDFDDFDASETFTLSVDVDPTSIKGNLNVGEAGSVAGVEMMGSVVTVGFSDGSTYTNDLIYVAGSQGGSESVVDASPADAPSIALAGTTDSPATVSDPDQSIVVTGPVGADVWLIQLDGRLNLIGVPNGGFDIEPFEANEAIGNTWDYVGTIEGDGDVAIPVTMRMTIKDSESSGGLNHFIAVVIDETAGRTSNVLKVELLAESMVNFTTGWNLIGLSYEVDDSDYETLFAPAAPTLPPFLWNGNGYGQVEEVNLGIGYWLEVANTADVTITGSDVPSIEVDVVTGWNMISGPSCILDEQQILDPGNIVIPNTLYRYENSYVQSTTMNPNVGYWIEVSGDGTLDLDCTANIFNAPSKREAAKTAPHADFGVLRVQNEVSRATDLYFGGRLDDESAKASYNMPPLALHGLDVRFSDNYRLAEGNEGVIKVQSDEFPLQLDVAALPKGSVEQFFVDAYINNEIVKSYPLYEGETVTLSNEKVTALKVRTGSLEVQSLPEAFVLSGNYPNPFNPTTNLVFDLPEDATMRVAVYDLLGRQVMALNAVEVSAGAGRQVQLDASSLASGTYVYRVQADMASGQIVQSGRMTLLK